MPKFIMGPGAPETDPTVPAWAKAQSKPTYTAQEVGALPSNTDLSSYAPKASPVFTTQITIGNTSMTEAQLSTLLNIASANGVSF